MTPGRIFPQPEINLQKLKDLTAVLDDINQVCNTLHEIYGMTDEVKRLCAIFYKIKIFLLQALIEEFRLSKESNDLINSDVDYIARLAEHEASLDEAHEDLKKYL